MWHEIPRSAFNFPVGEGDMVNRYFESTMEGEPVSYCHVQSKPGYDLAYIHHYVVKMSSHILREFRRDVPEFKAWLKSQGFKSIIGIRASTDDLKTWFHFIRLLNPFTVSESTMNNIPCTIVRVEV